MKLFRALGVAATLAIAATGILAITSASADTLCLSESYAETCPEAKKAAAGTKVTLELKEGKAVLGGALSIECGKSSAAGEITANGGATVQGKITAFSLTECTNCSEITAKEFGVAGKWGVAVNWLKFEGGTQFDEFAITEPRVEMQKCPLGVQCTASAAAINLDLTSTGAAVTIKAVNEALSLGICGNGTWSATYKVTAPLPSWVSQK